MSDIILMFSGVGIFVLLFLVILGVSLFLSWVWNDCDYTAAWLIVTVCYALTTTIFIMRSIR